MSNFWFIQDPTALQIITAVLNAAGPNFTAPYDYSSQPSDAVARNDEILTKYDVPGGTSIRGTSNPASSPSMGYVITSILTALGPIISAYGFILPILGVIRGIIEILCCLMNPYCVVPAIIRLFVKWIPPFISLFPTFAGAIIILSAIKLILAIVYFILTELMPTIELVKRNIKVVRDAVKSKNDAAVEAGKEKLIALLIDLANRIGIVAVAKPILDIIFLILGLVAGFPCSGGKKSSKSIGSMGFNGNIFDKNTLDTNCCDDNMCPPAISSPATGRALLIPRFFGDAPPLWSWMLIPLTGDKAKIRAIRPYLQDLQSQLNPQLDEGIDEAIPVGANTDAAHFRIRILGRRGEKFCVDSVDSKVPKGSFVVPIAKISNSATVTITNRNLLNYMGVVDYCIEPNFHMLIGRSILGVGCHPSVIEAKNRVRDRFGDLELSVLEKYPELGDIPDLYDNMTKTINNGIDTMNEVVRKDEYTDADLETITEVQELLAGTLFNMADSMKNRINVLLSRMADKINSEFFVDKNIVKAGGVDKAIVTVTPRDATGTAIAKNLPDGTDISVNLFTDFGVLQNQQRDNTTGIITAELISAFTGDANVMAKVNSDFIMEDVDVVKVEHVKFIADAVLPKRRVTSTPGSGTKTQTGTTAEREPGNR